uniref:Inosine-5'-monophosphate dehydrogenase n=1 Tax=candidate division WOR-3 bacterium TaxID=2052148 RepID=A0A7C4Y5A8_UNCW3
MEEFLTFDDVLILPEYSDVLPSQVDVSTLFSKNIRLNIPIVSSAMDTVTESSMAIAIALEGGIGVIHKNMSIKKQAEEVEKTKRFESGMISNPITLSPEDTIKMAIEIMRKNNISGLPVVDENMHLLGLITKRDLIFEENMKLKVREIMTPVEKLIIAEEGVTIEKAKEIFKREKVEKLPIVKKDGKLVGLITVKDILKRIDYPFAARDENGRLRCAAAVGTATDTIDRAKELVNAGADAIVIDTAHGHSEKVIQITRKLRDLVDVDIVVGNIGTAEAAKKLIEMDVDGIKVGIGPGSICTTRVVAGIGIPQLSAIMNVAKEKKDIPVIADGGIKYSGDITKALAAGADSVMIGNLLAGTEEAPGETIYLEGRKYKVYRGMGSIDAMREGGADRYLEKEKLVPEGVVGRVPYRGSVKEVVFQLIGGLKAGMGYTGSRNIRELQKKARFIKITNAGLKESHPHDITITKEPPNYEPPTI